MARRFAFLYLPFLLAVALHAAFAVSVRGERGTWLNVPPVPSEAGIAAFTLGDRQFAYRMTGLVLQNLGNTGGKAEPLAKYDYGKLAGWFSLADRLDPRSNFVPMMAAFYFGATQVTDDLTHVVDYLAEIGQRSDAHKWRWLAQAVYLARFQQGDLDKALRLANILAGQWHEGRPGWMKQMPVLIMTARGEKEAAYDLMLRTLQEEGDKMHPMEAKFMVDYICERILDEEEAAQNPLCEGQR